MDREKLIKQLFVGKVTEIIGTEKTTELLKEATVAIDEMLKSRKADVSGSNFRLAMYALNKIAMLYCIFNAEWLALSGFTIATIYAYIDMMSND